MEYFDPFNQKIEVGSIVAYFGRSSDISNGMNLGIVDGFKDANGEAKVKIINQVEGFVEGNDQMQGTKKTKPCYMRISRLVKISDELYPKYIKWAEATKWNNSMRFPGKIRMRR